MSHPAPTPVELTELRRYTEDQRYQNVRGEDSFVDRDRRRRSEILLALLDAYEKAPRETSDTIAAWRQSTFGSLPIGLEVQTIFERAQKEWSELVLSLLHDPTDPKNAAEAVDVIIVLAGLFPIFGKDMHAEIDAKMKINRARRWVVNGDGTGQHVPEETP